MTKVQGILLALLAVAAITVLTANHRLSHENDELKAQLSIELKRREAANSAMPGSILPPLKGYSPNGSRLTVNLQESPDTRVLLIFSAMCKACEDNWPNWDRLAAELKPGSLLAITWESLVSEEYLVRHHLAGRPVLVALDRATAAQMRLIMTPQTVVVNGGKVERSWVGVLSPKDLSDIIAAVDLPLRSLTMSSRRLGRPRGFRHDPRSPLFLFMQAIYDSGD